MSKRAVGIVRVSQTKGREGETFHSPITQRDRIVAECERQNFELIEVHEELDVSGGKTLDKRPGLAAAVAAVEAGDADVVMAAYLDRLTRSVRVRSEVVERVEAAGGLVFTVDMGIQSDATAGQWLSGTMHSAVAEYQRRTTAERTAVAQQRSIDRGIPPWPNVPPGYKWPVIGRAGNGRAIHGSYEVDPAVAPLIVKAYEMRAAGDTIDDVRAYLRSAGLRRSYRGVQSMLASRVYLGEIHFGSYAPNLDAHPALVTPGLFEAVQLVRVTRGTRPKSLRLLARLEVLRCGTCGARLVVGTQTQRGRKYPFYRCIPTSDCPRRVTIGAAMIEGAVVEAVKEALAGMVGRTSGEQRARDAEVALAKAEADIDAALRTFAGLEAEAGAKARLDELRAAREDARHRVEQLGGLRSSLTVTAADDWDRFSLEAQRALIRAVVARADVAPGRGLDRVTITLVE